MCAVDEDRLRPDHADDNHNIRPDQRCYTDPECHRNPNQHNDRGQYADKDNDGAELRPGT